MAIATTLTGVKQLLPLCDAGATLWIPRAIGADVEATPIVSQIQAYDSLKQQLTTEWAHYRGFIFCLATGAVVRLIAPLLHDKASDPAVVVVDEAGEFVISLCGGHQAGADALTRSIALQLGIIPVITGAANALNLPGIDVLGTPFGWVKGQGDWTGVSAAIARQEPVQVIQESGTTLWQRHLPAEHTFQFEAASAIRAQVWIGAIERIDAASSLPQAQWHPRVLWVGIGCERGTSRQVIETAVCQVFQAHHLAEAAIAGVATIDLKADEVGLLELCNDRHLPLRCFSAVQLRTIAVPNPSTTVAAEVGTPSVAEAAALLASQLAAKSSNEQPPLLVTKQIIRLPGHAGAVTVAVAQAQREWIDRPGQLWLIGTGPGALEQITPAAKTAIAQADVVIGYSLYIELIQPLLRSGQIVEALPITQERQRAHRAIELAYWGLTVAVVSSGDCGIYGMAGLVLEELQAQGWDGNTPSIQVFPGITALQAAAARVGAPLMHDFCAISLSDLLTPWAVIETRLLAAAQADFVVALYNPRSQTRIEQLAIAHQIFLKYRAADTPVAVVRAAYRPDEQVTVTTLAELLNQSIDMLTIVLIGNQSTRLYTNWMITPRGYLSAT